MRKLILLPTLLFFAACSNPKPSVQNPAAGINSGIVGGEELAATDEMAKSIVGIEIPFYGVYCSGILVAKNLVLTAGHCTTDAGESPKIMNIVFGADLKGQLQRRAVQGGRVPKSWPLMNPDMEKNWGDMALLRFEGEAPEGFVPARLLGTADHLKNGLKVILAGYGLTNMQPKEDPEKIMHTTVELTEALFSETELLFKQFDGRGACHGDSGGPAFARINDKLFLIGVTSRSATMAGASTCLEGSIYTSVPANIDFLRDSAKSLNSPEFVHNEPIPQPNLFGDFE